MTCALPDDQEKLCHDLELCAEGVLAEPDSYSSDTVDYARRCLQCIRRLLTDSADAGDS
ncbi:hypothetical protein [Caenispirillum bisanense]|uniref:hypothetical protein n=1 Tax=Caenispirillum bisanense TaxID=414052 RepID=UPI0031DDCDA5